jgi:hypothetical protein
VLFRRHEHEHEHGARDRGKRKGEASERERHKRRGPASDSDYYLIQGSEARRPPTPTPKLSPSAFFVLKSLELKSLHKENKRGGGAVVAPLGLGQSRTDSDCRTANVSRKKHFLCPLLGGPSVTELAVLLRHF